jgi:hypothetical protein
MEFLGTGPQYGKFEDVRKGLQPHIAKNAAEYERLTERFKHFSSLRLEGRNHGYRHRIIHEGALLEDILPEPEDRRVLFVEIDQYCGKVIADFCRRPEWNWKEMQAWRRQRTTELLSSAARK